MIWPDGHYRIVYCKTFGPSLKCTIDPKMSHSIQLARYIGYRTQGPLRAHLHVKRSLGKEVISIGYRLVVDKVVLDQCMTVYLKASGLFLRNGWDHLNFIGKNNKIRNATFCYKNEFPKSVIFKINCYSHPYLFYHTIKNISHHTVKRDHCNIITLGSRFQMKHEWYWLIV